MPRTGNLHENQKSQRMGQSQKVKVGKKNVKEHEAQAARSVVTRFTESSRGWKWTFTLGAGNRNWRPERSKEIEEEQTLLI